MVWKFSYSFFTACIIYNYNSTTNDKTMFILGSRYNTQIVARNKSPVPEKLCFIYDREVML